jgi:hypothetical protein
MEATKALRLPIEMNGSAAAKAIVQAWEAVVRLGQSKITATGGFVS